jgi:hypothetical protein
MMQGIPAHIQTREDVQNLFALAQQGEIEKAPLAEKIESLLAMQYYQTPILSIDGETVTTRYFPEVAVGATTEDGLTVEDVQHIEPPQDEAADEQGGGAEGMGYTETKITLSAAPADGATMLSIYKDDNFLTENGFDVAEINYILGVLAQ